MGVLQVLGVELARSLFSVSDAPFLPPGVGPALDAAASGRDPTVDDAMDTIIDMASGPSVKMPGGGEADVPFFGSDLAKEAYKEGKKNVQEYKENSPRAGRKKLDDILKNSREGNPDA